MQNRKEYQFIYNTEKTELIKFNEALNAYSTIKKEE